MRQHGPMPRAASTALSARLRYDIHVAHPCEGASGTAPRRSRQEGFGEEKSPRATTFCPKKSRCQTFNRQSYTRMASWPQPKKIDSEVGTVHASASCCEPYIAIGHALWYFHSTHPHGNLSTRPQKYFMYGTVWVRASMFNL